MNLLIALITYNRLEYTKRTVQYLRNTIKQPFYLVIVDNDSSDGTQRYIKTLKNSGFADHIIINPENYYPGKACNIAWKQGLKRYPEATHLMRLDNDMELTENWQKEVKSYFDKIPDLGQLGLDYDAIDNDMGQRNQLKINGKIIHPWPGCVGGPCVIKREVWDSGLRYDETPWHVDEGPYATMQEDAKFSLEISKHGWLFGHVHDRISWTFANKDNWKDYPTYYKQTFSERGYDLKQLEEDI